MLVLTNKYREKMTIYHYFSKTFEMFEMIWNLNLQLSKCHNTFK